jgi:hypothetical protein
MISVLRLHRHSRSPARATGRRTDVRWSWWAVAGAAFMASPADAVEFSGSGFATLGYTISDSDNRYLGFIDQGGSLRQDSLLAGQVDVRIAPEWSATVQAKVAQAPDSDTVVRPQLSWAFLAWRPNNDWLLRAGKMRLPLYLHSESLEVGVSHDQARMPPEMYSIAPTNDFVGLSAQRSLTDGDREYSVEASVGAADATARFWLRDGLPPQVSAGTSFVNIGTHAATLVLTSRDENLTWRAGALFARTNSRDHEGLPVRFPWVDLGGGLGYYKVDDSLPGPAIPYTRYIRNFALTLGGEWQIDPHWRVAGEVVRMWQFGTELGSDSRAGYVSLFRRTGDFTPYVSWAYQRSSNGLLNWHERLVNAKLPSAVTGADSINAAQRISGESLYAFDQRTGAVGVSYSWAPQFKLKAEWAHTQTGRASTHFAVRPDQADSSHLEVNVFTVNLNVAF